MILRVHRVLRRRRQSFGRYAGHYRVVVVALAWRYSHDVLLSSVQYFFSNERVAGCGLDYDCPGSRLLEEIVLHVPAVPATAVIAWRVARSLHIFMLLRERTLTLIVRSGICICYIADPETSTFKRLSTMHTYIHTYVRSPLVAGHT